MPGRADSSSVLRLPKPVTSGGEAIWPLICHRRSLRTFSATPLTLADLGQLLWATQGVTQTGWIPLRSAPSAGALYPIETYVSANRVEGLHRGLYHYTPRDHVLGQVYAGDAGEHLARAALGQDVIAKAAAAFVWSAVPARTETKYHRRAGRYIYLEVGHIAENLYLAAGALGLGCCARGAFVVSARPLYTSVQ